MEPVGRSVITVYRDATYAQSTTWCDCVGITITRRPDLAIWYREEQVRSSLIQFIINGVGLTLVAVTVCVHSIMALGYWAR